MPMNVVDIPLEIRRAMTILPLSRHTFKVSLVISHIILAVTTHTESTSVQIYQSQKCISCTWRNVSRRRGIQYGVNGCTEELSTRASIYHSECDYRTLTLIHAYMPLRFLDVREHTRYLSLLPPLPFHILHALPFNTYCAC